MTFGKALRAFLRQDPDIIMVGEIRDRDTADMAVQAGNAMNSLSSINDAYANAEYQGLGLWEQ